MSNEFGPGPPLQWCMPGHEIETRERVGRLLTADDLRHLLVVVERAEALIAGSDHP